MNYKSTFEQWERALGKTEPYGAELCKIEADPALLEDSFYQFLAFGTAGMRGILGLGTNRMNIFTVRRCSEGLARYILAHGGEKRGVAIAYDSRNMSDVFAKEAALIFAKNGIKVYLYESLRSVPQLSFALLKLNCFNGVVITASHNPREYSGYKVYGEDGGQVTVEDAGEITRSINGVSDYLSILPMDETEALEKGLLQYIGAEIDEQYYTMVKGLCLDPAVVKKHADDIRIVYTPLFGTGNKPVRRLLGDIGIRHLYVVPEQEHPNGDFPGLKAPNPEDRDAFKLAFQLADEVDANLIIATDPDCDRMGLAVKDSAGNYHILTGNQIGCLLLDYILDKKSDHFHGDEFVVTTIVSTDLATAIANAYGVEIRHVLTGFRFIAEQIKLSEETKSGRFLFGFEESYGYLAGTFVRDKDAAMASMLAAETVAHYADKGMTMYEAVNSLYEKYGYYFEEVLSVTLSGVHGVSMIENAVDALRNSPPKNIASMKVLSLADYQTRVETDFTTGVETKLTLPISNVLVFTLDGGKLILRPSGTEPKLKAYCSAHAAHQATARAHLQALVDETKALLKKLTK